MLASSPFPKENRIICRQRMHRSGRTTTSEGTRKQQDDVGQDSKKLEKQYQVGLFHAPHYHFQSAKQDPHQQSRTIIVTLDSIEVHTALDAELARLGELGEGEKIRDAAAMDTPCRECAEIAQEYREAIIDFWTNASDKTRDACGVAAKLTGCTERDAANADDNLRPFSSQELLRPAEKGQMRIAAAIYRKCFHQHRTGHYVNLRNG